MRARCEVSGTELYKALGWTKQRYWYHVNNGCVMLRTQMPALAKALDISPKELAEAEMTYYASR